MMNKITYSDFLDKVHGCWYGKCLGGAAGAPVEGIKKIIEVSDFEEIFNPDLPNDDLDIQLLWLDVLENKGININSCDLADAWLEKCWYPFSEYGYFIKNYERGIKPPYSGIINNSFFKEGMGCPIRSEIWGIISASNPELASKYAYTDAVLDHSDNSVYAEQFLAAAEAAAFLKNDIPAVVKTGMEYIPNNCRLANCFNDVFNCYDKGIDWLETRQVILKKYSHPDFTNVVQNMGFTLIALLYGNGNMRDTINIALKCGYDTDCTCASAAALLGIVLGYKNMGDVNSLIKDYFICGIDVVRPSDSIKGLAEDTVKIALKIENKYLEITDIPEEIGIIKKTKPQINTAKATEDGLKKALSQIKPICWEAYGPYFDQLDKPIDPNYPSPHGEGCVLPDIVCMVNNEVNLNKEYINEFTLNMPKCDFIGNILSYEDLIPIEETLTAEGQICLYLKAKLYSPKEQKVWIIVGNTDGFRLWLNGKDVLSKDEIRYYTPYNNFCLADLKKGENEVVIKVLRRTEIVKLAVGFRQYNGEHWHKSKWCTDLS